MNYDIVSRDRGYFLVFDILKFSTRIGIKDQSETDRSHLYLSPKKDVQKMCPKIGVQVVSANTQKPSTSRIKVCSI